MMVLDNEFSADLKTAFDEHKLSYQLVTPHKHKNNLAERAIQTWKSHFKAGLAGTDPDFPMAEWDRLIHQSNITLNLLRSSRVNPKLSAYAYIHGPFNFLSTPMAPPGTKVIVHTHPDKRASWELNGQHGWYVGPALNHYRCVKVYIPRTKSIITSDTVEFFPHSIPFPQVKLQDHLKQAASDIVSILATPPSTTVPTLEAGDETKNAILQLASILKRADKIPHLRDMTDKPLPRVIKPKAITPTIATNRKDTEVMRPPSMIPYNQDEIDKPPPRVAAHEVPMSTLFQPSSLPNNVRYRNTIDHQYNLRSKSNLIQHVHQNPSEDTIAQHVFDPQHHINHIYNESGKRETLDTLLKGSQQETWQRSLSNEWGRLAQGNDYNVKGTNTIVFISKSQVPSDKRVTCATMVCDFRPLKEEQYRVRITVGGDRLTHDNDAGSPAVDLLETKIMLNSTISDANKGARFMSIDIKDHFLATPMADPEFMRVPIKHIPPDMCKKYNIDNLVYNGWVCIKIQKGMPGLKQAAILAYQHLKRCLEPHGCTPVKGTIATWEHDKLPTKFCLCVDDFGVKYWSKSDSDHLCNSIGANFTYTVDK